MKKGEHGSMIEKRPIPPKSIECNVIKGSKKATKKKDVYETRKTKKVTDNDHTINKVEEFSMPIQEKSKIQKQRQNEIKKKDSINQQGQLPLQKETQSITNSNNNKCIKSNGTIHLIMLMSILDRISDEEIYALGEIVDDQWMNEIGMIINDPEVSPKVVQRSLFLAQSFHERDLMPIKEIQKLGQLVGKGQYEIILSGSFFLDENIIQLIFMERRIKAFIFCDEANQQFLFIASNDGVKGRILKGNDVFMQKINGIWQNLTLPEYICSVRIKEKNIIWLFETIRLSVDMRISCFEQNNQIHIGRYIKKLMIITFY
ncbi:hypothetical protein ENUP19_0297G0012 [Entamoeba nuttalli]|uniref:Uncharacterized protein n=2 Tax=Entamoeba nuttalli TaxID=412467 RepID=K2HSN3_ENTNP|nr:hypothetical protein ENU1_141760 [Entamoeba nuttalli P19]EKE39100.1 hypothetical protein ENU1_141760 [Entamoeba nuttalli P19]|eukprot:XP_008858561.1 hypothetical protein ENU1_141760 [Entamoeba nuttalli P19]